MRTLQSFIDASMLGDGALRYIVPSFAYKFEALSKPRKNGEP